MAKKNANRPPAPVIRICDLCGQAKTAYPMSHEHRQAHLHHQIAFVCQECADQVRLEVELAGESSPRVTA